MLKFDSNGKKIAKITKEESKSKVSLTRAELIVERYTCKRCNSKLTILTRDGESSVMCENCSRITSVWTLKEIN